MMTPLERKQAITTRLTKALEPVFLDITDDSADHAGHSGHGGMGHFTVAITSSAFEGKSLPDRHRLVYEALGDLMETDIHALRISAKTP